MPTTNFDVAVLPGRVWVSGIAPGSVTSVGVPTVVVIQALVTVPNAKKRSDMKPAEKGTQSKKDLHFLSLFYWQNMADTVDHCMQPRH